MNLKAEKLIQLTFLFLFICLLSLEFLKITNFILDKLFYRVTPLFADLITIIPSIEELGKLGISTKGKISSIETMDRPMNYPILWVYVFDFLNNFINPINLFGYSQIFFYTVISIYFLFKVKKNFLIYFFIFFSPPVFLIFDRGNNDMFIFFLICLSALNKKIISGLLIGIASALKVYPLFLVPIIFILKKDKLYFTIGIITSLPIIIFTFLQINIFIENTSISFSSSFGIITMALFINKILSFFVINQIPLQYLIIFSFLLFLSLLYLFNFFFKKILQNITKEIQISDRRAEIFIIFTSLSLFIFTIFSSWAYRIIFLIPSTYIILNCVNLKSKTTKLKEIILMLIVSSPFISTWLLFPTTNILLNHYIWAFYAPIVFISMALYSLILFYLIKAKYKLFIKE